MSMPTSNVSPGMQRQMDVYQAGVMGIKPSRPVAVEELEQQAKAVLTP